jgi:hypothetical protein
MPQKYLPKDQNKIENWGELAPPGLLAKHCTARRKKQGNT